jgi:hypothetical protein
VYLVAAVMAVVLTSRIRETAAADVPAEPPAGLERMRVLMDEIEETRRREQQRA